MGKPLTLINLDILENFRRMCVRDLRVDDMQDSSIAHDEEAQRTILARFYAYHHYLRANPDQAERLCSLCPVSGFQAFPAVRGVFKGFSDDDDVWDTDVTPIDILLALPRQNTQTPKAIQKEILGLYGNIVTYLTELRGIASHESDLERALRDAGFMRLGDDRHPIVIRLLLHLAPTKGQRKTIERAIDRVAEDYPRGPTLRIQFGDDIDYEVRNTESTFQYVPQGELVLDQADNRCEYREGTCRAMFVNVRAQSLRNLWKTCATRGLLAQNLRYYVSLPRVDNAMLKTMALEPKQFWYLNNGLTIVCDTYETHGNTLRLRNFSIVNGGQTTHNIGTVEELPNDFALPCKIIALEDQNRQPLSTDNRLDFIADVCTATNSQKPIKAADAVANRREIRELRRLLKADTRFAVCLQTKRGETIDKKLYPKPWQRVKVSLLGQLLLSFLYQYPCIARNNTKKIFEDDDLFALVFDYKSRPELLPNAPFIQDLLLVNQAIKTFQQRWKRRTVAIGDDANRQRKYLTLNCAFIFVACVGALCKLHTHPDLAQTVTNPGVANDRKLLGLYDVAFPFLDERDPVLLSDEQGDFQQLLFVCLNDFIRPGYAEYAKTTGREGDYANFAKSDDRYLGYVQKQILVAAQNGFSPETRALLGRLFRSPSQAEVAQLREQITQHPICWGADHDEFVGDLLDRILNACKVLPGTQRRGVTLPTKTALRSVINRRATTLAALNATKLSPGQVRAFGETILRTMHDAEREIGATSSSIVEERDPNDNDD